MIDLDELQRRAEVILEYGGAYDRMLKICEKDPLGKGMGAYADYMRMKAAFENNAPIVAQGLTELISELRAARRCIEAAREWLLSESVADAVGPGIESVKDPKVMCYEARIATDKALQAYDAARTE